MLISTASDKLQSQHEHCGIPDSMGKAEEEFPKVRTTGNLDDRQLRNKLT